METTTITYTLAHATPTHDAALPSIGNGDATTFLQQSAEKNDGTGATATAALSVEAAAPAEAGSSKSDTSFLDKKVLNEVTTNKGAIYKYGEQQAEENNETLQEYRKKKVLQLHIVLQERQHRQPFSCRKCFGASFPSCFPL